MKKGGLGGFFYQNNQILRLKYSVNTHLYGSTYIWLLVGIEYFTEESKIKWLEMSFLLSLGAENWGGSNIRENVINLCSKLLWKDLNCSHVVFFGEMWRIMVIGITNISAIITWFLAIIDRGSSLILCAVDLHIF